MVKRFILKEDRVIMKAKPGMKPTRFRFEGNRRLGFKGKKVVEIVKFKKVRVRNG